MDTSVHQGQISFVHVNEERRMVSEVRCLRRCKVLRLWNSTSKVSILPGGGSVMDLLRTSPVTLIRNKQQLMNDKENIDA